MRSKSGFKAQSLRPTSTVDSFPWLARLLTLVRISQEGVVSQAKTEAEKRAMLGEAHDADLLLAAWPGEWSQDVFVVDDLAAARLAVGLPRRQATPTAVDPAGSPPTESSEPQPYVAPGRLWQHLGQIPALPVEGQRQLAARFADRGPSEAAIALLRRSDVDPSARRLLLESLSSWHARPLVGDEACTTSEALDLLDRFRTDAGVLDAALRRPDTRDAARRIIGQLSYLEAAKLWLDSHAWSPQPRQRPELANAVLWVVLSKEPPDLSTSSGYGSDRYERSAMVRVLMEQLPDSMRQEFLRDPARGRLVQQALLAGADLTDDDLVACLPEVLREPGPLSADANPDLLQYVQRFPRLAELGGSCLRHAVAGLATAGWSPLQAARSGRWDVLLAAARLTDDPDLIDALVRAAVFDRTPPPALAAATRWRDPRRYELVDLLLSKTVLSEDQTRYVLDRLTVDHIEELQESARKRSKLHRLCTQALLSRRPAQLPPTHRADPQSVPDLPTDEELSAMADPRTVLRDLLRDRSPHRSTVIDHALNSTFMQDDLAWRLPVQDLERHPRYGPRLAAKVADICGDSPSRWQALARSWAQPTQLLASTLFNRLEESEKSE